MCRTPQDTKKISLKVCKKAAADASNMNQAKLKTKQWKRVVTLLLTE